MVHLDYRGTQSATFQLVLFAFLMATLMLLMDKITGSDWTSSAMGLVSAFALKEAVSAGAEAYRDKPASTNISGGTTTTTTETS